MRVTGFRYLSGPNIHEDAGGLVIATELPPLLAAGQPIAVAPGRCERVFATLGLPGLGRRWAAEAAGGRAAVPGTLCRVAVALIGRASIFGSGARVLAPAEPELRVFLRCEHQSLGLLAWDCACRALLASGPDADGLPAFEAAHGAFEAAARAFRADIMTAALARDAQRLGVPWFRLQMPGRLVQIGQGAQRRFLLQTMGDSTGAASRSVASDKRLLNELLRAAGVPVMPMLEATGEDAAVAAAERIGYPVVVKPRGGSNGRGVSVNLTGGEAVAAAWQRAAAWGRGVIVEKLAEGESYRALLIQGKLVAAAHMLPAQVVGDGRLTVAQLVDRLNQDPRRAPGHDNLLVLVGIDEEARALLAEQGLTPDRIVEPGRRVLLRRTVNISAGGTALDVSDAVHPDNRAMLERAACVLQLGITGIDFIMPDLARPWHEVGAAVLELNAVPGLRPHWLADPGRSVTEPILRALLPPGGDGRIPTCGITGTHGKTTTANMVARILGATGLTVGRCTTVGVTVGEERRRSGDCAGGRYARELLLDPQLEAGVFELARGGLLNEGMTIEDCDVGAVLNVLDNHIGSDGITSRADLARIKSIVARRARRALVLNAEDPLCLAMREGAMAERLWLVAHDPAAPALVDHRAAGGAAVFLPTAAEGGAIMLTTDGGAGTAVIAPRDIPATLGGHHLGKLWNAMFATAIAYAMGAPLERIREGLRSFKPDMADSQGRCSIIDRHPFRVLLDYGTGGDAIGQLVDAVRAMPVAGRRLVYVMAAGRSEDALIRGTGRALAGVFDLYVCTDWAKRPRPDPQAVPRLLRDGIVAGGVEPERVVCLPGRSGRSGWCWRGRAPATWWW
jgi:cyanophycin synthetase